MQFTEYDEICEECGDEIDPSEIKTHPHGHDLVHPQYVCIRCHDHLLEVGNETAQEAEDTGPTVYQEDWSES